MKVGENVELAWHIKYQQQQIMVLIEYFNLRLFFKGIYQHQNVNYVNM